ncbi:MAG: hypothetical protein ACYC0Z_15470 [Acidobacteriaceae bacterium]
MLTGESDAQQKIFYDDVLVGSRLLVFGAVHTFNKDPMAAPEILDPEKENNYRRWWNNPWSVVEAGGQTHAGDWTPQDRMRLKSLVEYAHANGLWIRFYTLDDAPLGHSHDVQHLRRRGDRRNDHHRSESCETGF